jgi:hypothetical protein
MSMISEATKSAHRNGGLQRTPIPVDLQAVCLWSALGLLLTMLAFAPGIGVEIGQALAAAG